MKLQKLLYYSQAWHLAWNGEPLFPEEIRAWANGPVVYEVFDKHRGRFSVESWTFGNSSQLTAKERGVVDIVLESYSKLTGRQLSLLTHDEDPWKNARKGLGPTDLSSAVIEKDDIAAYYSALDASDEATPVDELIADEDEPF